MLFRSTPAAKQLLATKGYDAAMGARPLRRTIQREIEDILSEKILFGEIGAGELVLVDAVGEGSAASFTFTPTPIATTPDTPGDLQEAPTN